MDLFVNPDDAAKDAVDFIISTQSQYEGDPEWGGWIYRTKNADGKVRYSYTKPVCGEKNKISPKKFKQPPEGTRKVAAYHTHPGSGWKAEKFSEDDYWWAGLSGCTLYMGTRSSLLMRYTPSHIFSRKPSEEKIIRWEYNKKTKKK